MECLNRIVREQAVYCVALLLPCITHHDIFPTVSSMANMLLGEIRTYPQYKVWSEFDAKHSSNGTSLGMPLGVVILRGQKLVGTFP